jgi:hypothetical protein
MIRDEAALVSSWNDHWREDLLLASLRKLTSQG